MSVRSVRSAWEPTPNWNTSTISPNVALTDRVFMMIALIGTSTERKATASMTPVAPRMSRTRSGKRSSRSVWKSSAEAV